ncbi:MAG: caspase family protein [Sterolibacteriaceae bacterium]|nr:caspase family protein [Sterolibacteriaceae bacterium]
MRRHRRSPFIVLIVATFLAWGAPPVLAARYALLVGVSDYPNTSAFKPLRGPRNDVERMRRILSGRRFDATNITVLADGIGGAEQPTRKNILAALERLATQAKAGDFVYLHFSGHGSQQPALRLPPGADPEPDASSEIFLPIDVGHWDGKRAAVENAIADHELIAILKRIIAKDTFVWSVFDACHSATLMRSGDQDVRVRQVPPEALGIPESAWAEARKQARERGTQTRGAAAEDPLHIDSQNPAGRGRYVSFYGAQTTEEAPEMPMPLGLSAGDPRKRLHGVLSYTLAEALESLDGISYRQLSEFILQRYATQNISRKPTPAFSGSGLDAPVFGSAGGGPVLRQWAVEKRDGVAVVNAGLLSQVSEGAILGLFAAPQAKDSERIAEAKVVSTDIFESRIELLPNADGKTPALPNAAYARMLRPNISFKLRVAQPATPASDDKAGQLVRTALEAVRSRTSDAARFEWVGWGKPADVRLHVEQGRLWFLPAAGALVKDVPGAAATPSVAVKGAVQDLQSVLGKSLDRIAKATRLMRAVQGVGTLKPAAGLEIKLTRLPGGKTGAGEPLRPGGTPQLTAGDVVRFEIANKTPSAVDVTLLYVDAAYGSPRCFPTKGSSIALGAATRCVASTSTPILVVSSSRTTRWAASASLCLPCLPDPRVARWTLASSRRPGLSRAATRARKPRTGSPRQCSRAAARNRPVVVPAD